VLARAPHEVSVFEDSSGDPPGTMQRRNGNQFPDITAGNGDRGLQRRLQAALEARSKAVRRAVTRRGGLPAQLRPGKARDKSHQS
jgi:hypothetical protein